jgi:hypothetical protein
MTTNSIPADSPVQLALIPSAVDTARRAVDPLGRELDTARWLLREVLAAGPSPKQALLIQQAVDRLNMGIPSEFCANEATATFSLQAPETLTPEEGISRALDHLDMAVNMGSSITEICRYASTACLLARALRVGTS